MMEKIDDKGKYRITLRTDRRLIPAGQSCQRYLYLILTAPVAPRKDERPVLNLSLILDRSGSMSGDKLAYVKQAAKHALYLLNEDDRASVVIYDNEVEVLAPSQPMNPVNRERMLKAVHAVRTGGMTNLSGGWFNGCDQIADHQTAEAINRALLLTDGLANQGITDQEELAGHAKALYQRGIATTTLGVGNDFNEFLLQAIADAGGGHFYFIDSPDQIPNYFKGELGEMLETVARETTLTLKVPAGISARLINDTPHEVTEESTRIFLGDAYSGQTHELVLRLDMPARPLDQQAQLKVVPELAHYDVSAQSSCRIDAEPLVYTIASPAQVASQQVDEEVLSVAARLEVEGAKLRAMRLEREGQQDDAQALLRKTVQAIAAFAPAPAVQTAQAELKELEEEVREGMSQARRKAVTYRAYMAHHSRRDYKK
jgi:Ca-activated chloride channel family protein